MTQLQFAAFGQDDARLSGKEIGPVYLTTARGALCAGPLIGGEKGVDVGFAEANAISGGVAAGFVVNVRWAMPEFGYLWLQADNGGQSYRLPVGEATQVWNLNYELARTRVLWNSQLEAVAQQSGIAVTGTLRRALAEAGSLLHDAMFANHDRRSRLADAALAKAIDAGERLAIRVAEGVIASGRRAATMEAALGGAGDGVAASPERLRHVGPVHGDRLPEGESAELWAAIFDEGTVSFPATVVEGGNDAAQRAAVEWLEARGKRVRGRCLVPWLDEHGQPSPPANDDEARRRREAAVRLVQRWHGRVATWDLLPVRPAMRVAAERLPWLVETVAAVKAACPDVEIVMSGGDIFAHRMNTGGQRQAWDPVGVLSNAAWKSQPLDGAAIPLFYPGCDVFQIYRMVDLMGEIDTPIHLLMASAPSQWTEDPDAWVGAAEVGFARQLGYWRAPWTEAVQAQWGLAVAAMSRAHPAVVALEWSDWDEAGPHAFPHGGLIDTAGRPKQWARVWAEAKSRDYAFEQSWENGLEFDGPPEGQR